MRELLIKHLVHEEGLRLHPYQDHLGYWTVGIGHCIDSRRGCKIPVWVQSFPIQEDDAYRILDHDIHKVETMLWRALPWFGQLSQTRRVVLASMAFQMGVAGLLTFRNMLADLAALNYKHAANEMLNSRWAEQTPKRAIRLADAMRTDDSKFLVRGA